MRVLIVALALISSIAAQPQQPFSSLMGTVTGIAGDQLTIRNGAVSTLLHADKDSQIWRGKTTNTLSILQLNDEVLIRYRRNPTRGLVILDLYANIVHIWGRISKVTSGGFEVDQNFNADPQSSYQRGYRQISCNADTIFEGGVPEDLRVGETVDIVGLKTKDSEVAAARVIIHSDRPLPAGTRVTTPKDPSGL
jgi:hypothetical protein